jgi:phosphate transport system substrate-binding protein
MKNLIRKPVDALVKQLLRYILSRQGQAAVAGDGGYLPLTADMAPRPA